MIKYSWKLLMPDSSQRQVQGRFQEYIEKEEEYQMKIKRCMAFVLSAVLAVAGLPVSATAAPTDANGEIGRNQEIVYVEPAQETEDLLGNLPDNDELFQMYVDGLFFGNPSVSVYGDFGSQKLEGLNLEAYRHLKEKIHQWEKQQVPRLQ